LFLQLKRKMDKTALAQVGVDLKGGKPKGHPHSPITELVAEMRLKLMFKREKP